MVILSSRLEGDDLNDAATRTMLGTDPRVGVSSCQALMALAQKFGEVKLPGFEEKWSGAHILSVCYDREAETFSVSEYDECF